MFSSKNSLLALGFISTTFLSGCGGGGGSEIQSNGLSTIQNNFENSTLLGSTYSGLDWNIPTTNVAVTKDTHFFIANNYSISGSPSKGDTILEMTSDNMASTTQIPDPAKINPFRTIKNRVIYAGNNQSKIVVNYVGNNIETTHYATDGLTVLYKQTFDDWSTPFLLTGTISSTNEVKRFFAIFNTNQTINFDFSKSWLPGSSYVTRKRFYSTDVVKLIDWSGSTYDVNVTPAASNTQSIESYFINNPSGITRCKLTYNLSDGSIKDIEGVRTWVGNNKFPSSCYVTDSYPTFSELNGKIYSGILIKSGTRENSLDLIDSTKILDYSIRFNKTAVESIKLAVNF